MEDEIDLRAYLDVLVRWWKWIVGVTLVAALVAGAVSFATPPTYEATVAVFVLFSQTTSAQPGSKALMSPQAQLALLQSNEIAQRVAQTLGDKLSAEEKKELLRMGIGGTGAVRVTTDQNDKSLFRVTAQAIQAQRAADIANAWADAGAEAINQAENQSLSQSIPMLQQDVGRTGKDLQTAEENLKRGCSVTFRLIY